MESYLILNRETKGTFVYSDPKDNATIPTLYIKKSAFPEGAPKNIILTIKESHV